MQNIQVRPINVGHSAGLEQAKKAINMAHWHTISLFSELELLTMH